MKIKFNADNDVSDHCLCGFRLLAPLHMCAMSYRPQNTAHFGIAATAIVFVLVERRAEAKGH